MANYSLQSTLYLPVSGDPLGFNHIMAAEWMLRNVPELERAVFVISNGHHPDPTKLGAQAPAAQRMRMAEATLAEAADPARSWLARRAAQAGDSLRAVPERLALSPLELAYRRAVRTAETAALLRAQAAPGSSERVNLFAGADLVRRMADPAIFSDADMRELAASCRYFLLDRAGDRAEDALARFRQARGLTLDARVVLSASMPDWLAAFLPLASTLIRNCAEAGDPLEGMMTAGAAAIARDEGLYRSGTPGYHIVNAQGHPRGETTALKRAWEALREEMAAAAEPVARAFTTRRARGEAGTLSIVEGCCGGALSWAFGSRSGASRFLAQSRFAYDRRAKATLLGEEPGGSSVSAEMVARLAQAMRRDAGTDFAIAESGMAGPPDGQRKSTKYGECWFAFASPDGTQTTSLALNPFLTRQEHQLRFVVHALRWVGTLLGS